MQFGVQCFGIPCLVAIASLKNSQESLNMLGMKQRFRNRLVKCRMHIERGLTIRQGDADAFLALVLMEAILEH